MYNNDQVQDATPLGGGYVSVPNVWGPVLTDSWGMPQASVLHPTMGLEAHQFQVQMQQAPNYFEQ